jgi:hypothetical protein
VRLAPGAAFADRGGQAIGSVSVPRRAEPAGQPVRLAPRPRVLAGREELLAGLAARLVADPGRRGPRVVVLCGLGGAGKTSVAVELAHRMLGETGVCWQLSAEDPALLAAEFRVLAAQLGALGLADARDPMAAVHAVLARAGAPWLLVLDNAPGYEEVAGILPPAGQGRVVVTSQSQHWPPGMAVQVPVLDTGVASGFLTARTGDGDHNAAAELARELGGLPLALEQAAAFMLATGMPLATYLAEFRRQQDTLLARGQAAGHREHVAATLGFALNRLDQQAPPAAALVRLLAVLSPEPAPLGILLAGTGGLDGLDGDAAEALRPLAGDPVAAGDAVAGLRRYSLAGLMHGGQAVQAHRLVQAVTRARMTPTESGHWQQAAAALVEAAIPADPQDPQAWPTFLALLPHAQAVLAPVSSGLRDIARYLGHSGSYRAARDLFTRIADAHEASEHYGPDHPETLVARAGLAEWTGDAGDAAAARDQYRGLVLVRERVSGPDHPETLAARARLAYWTGIAGDFAAARDQYRSLVLVRERVSGPDHPETVRYRADLAYLTGMAGDAAAARDQYRSLVLVRERVSGPDHPETLRDRADLAHWTGMAGDAAAARDQYRDLLPIRERVFGPDHPWTLTTRADLARWTGDAGDPVAARDQYRDLVLVRERVSGPDHPSTILARSGLADWTGNAGDAAAARDQCRDLLPTRERVSGPNSPSTLIARARLAYWTDQIADEQLRSQPEEDERP